MIILRFGLKHNHLSSLLKSSSTINKLIDRKMSWKQEKEKYLGMSLDEKRKEYHCKNKFTTLESIQTWSLFAKLKNIRGQRSDSNEAFREDFNNKVSVFVGDITSLEIDAIVNAANARLAGGGGVDGAIHTAAGRQLLHAECSTLDGCETGNSKITGGYKLPAKYVIHTVGPVGEKPNLLESCYKTALDLMESNGLKSIAFPCISTGIYHYPNENAAHVALATVRNWLNSKAYSNQVERIIFCLFLPIDVEIYNKLMPKYFPLE